VKALWEVHWVYGQPLDVHPDISLSKHVDDHKDHIAIPNYEMEEKSHCHFDRKKHDDHDVLDVLLVQRRVPLAPSKENDDTLPYYSVVVKYLHL
jgi:hypothetical protein